MSGPSATRSTNGESRDLPLTNRISRLVCRYAPHSPAFAGRQARNQYLLDARHSSTTHALRACFARNDNTIDYQSRRKSVIGSDADDFCRESRRMTECKTTLYFEPAYRQRQASDSESRNLFRLLTGSLDSPFESFAFRFSSDGSLEMWGGMYTTFVTQDDKPRSLSILTFAGRLWRGM
jgi:hypothetical protein